ncbi:MAG: helix-turn-helix transcriptional regulator [Dehalococcoidia bacterium]|nr:helix-turn-helix transcriptional regulator [Dehalococcoidia bacterium]
MSIGKRIRKRRQLLEMTQKELAEAIGVTPQHISAVEQDKRDPSLSSLAKLAEELGVTIDYLVTGKESVITDTIPAIKGDKKLKLKAKKALTALIQELYEATGSE